MYKWEIHIVLNSGLDIIGRYDGIESNSAEVVKTLFQGKGDRDYIPLYDVTKTHSLFIKMGDVSVIDIYVFKEEV